MGENTKIQWATHTFNHVRGCEKIAPGCANCYAEALSKRNPGVFGKWGPNGTRVLAAESMWRQPVKWDLDAERRAVLYESDPELDAYERPRVFCASVSDVFEDWKGPILNSRGIEVAVDREGAFSSFDPRRNSSTDRKATMADVRARLSGLWDATQNLDWLVLTKRIENARRMWCSHANTDGRPPSNLFRKNVWLGTSVACRDDLRALDELRKCGDLSRFLFLSIEPLIEELGELDLRGIDWVIVGGESGPHARPCNVDWIRLIVRQCKDAGVPVFVKQLGAKSYSDIDIDDQPIPMARDRHFWTHRDKQGGDPSEWPEDLRVREVPQ